VVYFFRHGNTMRIFPTGIFLDNNYQRKIRLRQHPRNLSDKRNFHLLPYTINIRRNLPRSLPHTCIHNRPWIFQNLRTDFKNNLHLHFYLLLRFNGNLFLRIHYDFSGNTNSVINKLIRRLPVSKKRRHKLHYKPSQAIQHLPPPTHKHQLSHSQIRHTHHPSPTPQLTAQHRLAS
jgi:hypothetical protein